MHVRPKPSLPEEGSRWLVPSSEPPHPTSWLAESRPVSQDCCQEVELPVAGFESLWQYDFPLSNANMPNLGSCMAEEVVFGDKSIVCMVDMEVVVNESKHYMTSEVSVLCYY